MNVNEVPQDGLEYKDRDKVRKLMYATDKDGNYTGVPSVGWDAENTATEQAWNEIESSLAETTTNVRAGKISPIAYFMERSLMDNSLLASYVGKWKWTVKRHMKPDVFAKMSEETLATYARIFNVSVDELRNFGKK